MNKYCNNEDYVFFLVIIRTVLTVSPYFPETYNILTSIILYKANIPMAHIFDGYFEYKNNKINIILTLQNTFIIVIHFRSEVHKNIYL